MKKWFLISLVLLVNPVYAKQYYIANVIGSGVRGDPYRLDISTGFNYSAVIPSLSNGTPIFSWGICITTTTLPAKTGLISIPNVSLNTSTSTLTAQQVTNINNALVNHGMPTTFLSDSPTLRELIRSIGRFLESNFDENRFDVGP